MQLPQSVHLCKFSISSQYVLKMSIFLQHQIVSKVPSENTPLQFIVNQISNYLKNISLICHT